jgi:hypothetical protein
MCFVVVPGSKSLPIAAPVGCSSPRIPAGTAADAPLACLTGGASASRFHAWRGRSGRRYVCTVFPAAPWAPNRGLPDFTEGVAIAVGRDRDGGRRLLTAFDIGESPRRVAMGVRIAETAGVVEWHLHLLASELTQRRAALADLQPPAFG